MADIRQAGGQLVEALRIRQEELLPVFERLGDVRKAAFAQAKIGLQQFDTGKQNAGQVLLTRALAVFEHLGLPEAKQLRQMMQQRGVSPWAAAPQQNSTPSGAKQATAARWSKSLTRVLLIHLDRHAGKGFQPQEDRGLVIDLFLADTP